MKSKSAIIIFSLIALFLSIYLPFRFKDDSETFNQVINIVGTLIAAFASLMTLVLALKLYKKYGIDTAIIDKRTEIVFNLLEKINSITFFVESKEVSFAVSMDSSDKKYLEEFYKLKLVFSNAYLEEIEKLFAISSNPFTPLPIVKKMEVIKFRILSFTVKAGENTSYAKLYPLGHRNEKENFGQLNSKETTLFDFIVMYEDVKNATVEWIRENSSINSAGLNI